MRIASRGADIALIGVDAQRDAGPNGFANPPHHLDVAIGIDADLDLDGPDALRGDRSALRASASSNPIRPIEWVTGTSRRAQPPSSSAAGNAERAAGEIVGGDLDRGLGVRIALDRPVHPRMQFGEIADLSADHGLAQISVDDLIVVPGDSPK